MSRYTVAELPHLSRQQIFERAAYHMLAHGGSPIEQFIKPERERDRVGMSYAYLVRQRRAPKHAAQLLIDLDTLHRDVDPAQWPERIVILARHHHLSI